MRVTAAFSVISTPLVTTSVYVPGVQIRLPVAGSTMLKNALVTSILRKREGRKGGRRGSGRSEKSAREEGEQEQKRRRGKRRRSRYRTRKRDRERRDGVEGKRERDARRKK